MAHSMAGCSLPISTIVPETCCLPAACPAVLFSPGTAAGTLTSITAVAGSTIWRDACLIRSSLHAKKCTRRVMRTYLSAGFLLLTLGAIAQTQPGSVADAAKSGNQAKKSRRVITNDDIPSRPEPAPETVGAPMTKQEATTPAAASEEKAKPEPEKSVPVQDSEAVK